jgi:protein-S-isoprenylcysteine O-methyltransferase Ste14
VLLGIGLLSWIVKHLGWRGLIAYSELKPQIASQKLITNGPFSVVRHPTYLAHTLMFVGIFLMTGFVGTGLLALLDFITSCFVITPMEERELSVRFGDEYRTYKEEVPRFLPWPLSKRKL